MNSQAIKEKDRLTFWDTLLIIGIITSSMTSLRVWKIGIAEVTIFIWSLKILLSNRFKVKIDIYIKFIILFDLCLFLGFVNRILKDITSGSPIEEGLTFVFFSVYIIALTQFLQNISSNKIIYIYKNIFVYGIIVYFGLYIYSIFVSNNLFGYPLWYGKDRLSLLANNPHQFTFFVAPTGLLGIFLINTKDN